MAAALSGHVHARSRKHGRLRGGHATRPRTRDSRPPPLKRWATPAIVCAIIVLGARCAPAAADDDRLAQRITPVVRVFKQASPAVVNISATTIVEMRGPFGGRSIFDDIFDFPFAPQRYKATSVGSGFVIQSDGYVVTNAHVVARTAERKISCADGTELTADIVAVDPQHDLAVLKMDARKPLPHLKLGRSDDLMPGETVIAVGNPLGYNHTVTVGIISALNRELRFGDVTYSGLIQTDASINHGNSGGPLLNVLGELIGINTAIRGDAQNIGFAIPVDRLHELLPVMLDLERLRRVTLGIRFGPSVAADGASGVAVQAVAPDSPAAKTGVLAGDVVTAIDDHETPSFIEAFSVLDNAAVGRRLKLNVLRKDGQRVSHELALAQLPQPDGAELMWKRFGLRVREMDPRELRDMELARAPGLIVAEVGPGSNAGRDGVAPNDILTRIGGVTVTTLDAAGHLLESVRTGDRVRVVVLRIGRNAAYQADLFLRAE